MAVIPYTQLPSPVWLQRGGVVVFQWPNVGNTDTCQALDLGHHIDRTVQVTGTLDGAAVKIDGSHEASLPYAPLTDPQGNDISISAYPAGYVSKVEAISEATRLIRPAVSGGTTPAVTITLYVRKNP